MMPLDAQDKLRVETIEQHLGNITATEKVRQALVKSGTETIRIMLELVPPDSHWRERIIQHFEDCVDMVAMATAPKSAA
jgi:urease accessory protein UreF